MVNCGEAPKKQSEMFHAAVRSNGQRLLNARFNWGFKVSITVTEGSDWQKGRQGNSRPLVPICHRLRFLCNGKRLFAFQQAICAPDEVWTGGRTTSGDLLIQSQKPWRA